MDAPPVTLRSAKDREIVHLEYDDPLNVPSVPSGYTRFVCVSDTHSRRFPVPDGDVLLHSGDLTNTGTLAEFEQTMDWICGLPHKLKMSALPTISLHTVNPLAESSLEIMTCHYMPNGTSRTTLDGREMVILRRRYVRITWLLMRS